MQDFNYLFTKDLLPGESILWSGQPTNKLLSSADFFMIPFSLLWGGFAIFWEVSVIKEGAPVFMAVFGIPFVAIGLYFIFGRFIYKKHRIRHTYYAVTDRRALIKYTTGRASFESVILRNVVNISKSMDKDSSGSVIFGSQSLQSKMYTNTGMEPLIHLRGESALGFYDITDVDKVYDLALTAQAMPSNKRDDIETESKNL